MKTQEEIEQLAEKYATSIYGFSNENYNDYLKCKRHCIIFYTQCQEDMADKKYTEEDVINALHSVELKNNKDYSKIFEGMKEYFNVLNKQD